MDAAIDAAVTAYELNAIADRVSRAGLPRPVVDRLQRRFAARAHVLWPGQIW